MSSGGRPIQSTSPTMAEPFLGHGPTHLRGGLLPDLIDHHQIATGSVGLSPEQGLAVR